jgi:WXG100 family type VII secretion target
MAGFVTETSQMQTAAAHVDDVSAQLTTLLTALREEVATAPAHFRGAAASTFQQLMSQYDMDAAKLREALNGISQQISEAGKSYGVQDAAQSDALRSSGSGLNM